MVPKQTEACGVNSLLNITFSVRCTVTCGLRILKTTHLNYNYFLPSNKFFHSDLKIAYELGTLDKM